MRANSASTQSELGGRSHGHLGVTGDDTSYFKLAGHQCTRPAHPGLLAIAAGTIRHESDYLREEHSEATRLFRETLKEEIFIKKNPSPLNKLVFENFATKAITPLLISSPKL